MNDFPHGDDADPPVLRIDGQPSATPYTDPSSGSGSDHVWTSTRTASTTRSSSSWAPA